MRSSSRFLALCLLAAAVLQAQTPPAPPRRMGGFVPGQHREPGDPAQIERGKTIYGIHCGLCHGPDLRGGDMGGPNLLRSQVALLDQHGELILPIIQGSRQSAGMPAIAISPEDGLAAAAYIRSVEEMIGGQGRPPSVGRQAPTVLVGNAAEGQVYFAAKCASCHSPTGDLQGIATRFADPKDLQTTWVRGRAPSRPPVTVTVFLPKGDRLEGQLIHVDDFLVSMRLADGTVRSFQRIGQLPKVEVHDPMKIHRDLLTQYTDHDIHDVTAFLATLK